MTAHALEAHPDVGLDVLEQVSEMDRPIDVGQRAGGEDPSVMAGPFAVLWADVAGGRSHGMARAGWPLPRLEKSATIPSS